MFCFVVFLGWDIVNSSRKLTPLFCCFSQVGLSKLIKKANASVLLFFSGGT